VLSPTRLAFLPAALTSALRDLAVLRRGSRLNPVSLIEMEHYPCCKFREKIGALGGKQVAVEGVLLDPSHAWHGDEQGSGGFAISNGIDCASQISYRRVSSSQPSTGSRAILHLKAERRRIGRANNKTALTSGRSPEIVFDVVDWLRLGNILQIDPTREKAMRSQAAQRAVSDLDHSEFPTCRVTVMAVGQKQRPAAQSGLHTLDATRSIDTPILVHTANAVLHYNFRRSLWLYCQCERIIRIVAPEPERSGIVKPVRKRPAYGHHLRSDRFLMGQNTRALQIEHSHNADTCTFLRLAGQIEPLPVDEQAGGIGLRRISRERRGPFFAGDVERTGRSESREEWKESRQAETVSVAGTGLSAHAASWFHANFHQKRLEELRLCS
jgi:hypothetical protein